MFSGDKFRGCTLRRSDTCVYTRTECVCTGGGERTGRSWRVGDVVVSNVARCRTARGAQIFRAASYEDVFRASPLSLLVFS